MKPLDNLKKIKKIDQSSVLESAGLFPEQIKQAWSEVFKLELPLDSFKKVKNIVVAGMGGSALGARMIDSLNFEILDLPLEIVNGYHLPAYANQDSLVIISSYSGNTQETIACCLEAIKKKCQIFVIATGGKLAELAKEKDLAAYIFRPTYNPSGQPRLGLGYSITAQLALLARCGFVHLSENQITEVINQLKKLKEKINLNVPFKKNDAKQIASLLKDKMAVLVSSEHLEGAAHAFKNFLNENSKTFAVEFGLPEMNHHLLEGLRFPKENKKLLKFIFLESEIYDTEIKKRIEVTKKVVKKNGLTFLSLEMVGKTRLLQAFDTIYLGGFVSGYLAILNGIDPAPIPWVDFFKKQLAAHEKKD